MTPVDSAVVLQGVSKRYGAKVALDNLDLIIAPGRIVGLLGPNGSGKTGEARVFFPCAVFAIQLENRGGGHSPWVLRFTTGRRHSIKFGW